MLARDDGTMLGRLWTLKSHLTKSPLAYRVFTAITKATGEGRVCRIRLGPMRGFRWKRYNAFPFWYHLGLYEPHVSGLIARHLRPGDVFWDIGANAGYHTLMGARAVGPRGKVLAVEADPDTCAVLREQVALNGLDNVEIVHGAIGAADGEVTLTRKRNNLQSVIASISQDGEALSVPGIRLDTLLRDFGRPHLVKMDIEGAEVLALPAGEALLSGPERPRLLLSTHGAEAARFCRRLLAAHDYDAREEQGFEQMLVGLPTRC